MSKQYPTPHINAVPDDFAKTVLMPGDPLRSKFIAENFLEDIKLINNVRSVQGYTGYYNNTKVTVMASGMGMPSMGIYSYELFNFFGVENIIRIGSAGSINPDINVRDIVIAMGACTNSNYASQYNLPGTFAPICSYELLKICTDEADRMRLKYHVGNVLSADTFYNDEENIPTQQRSAALWGKMGVMAIEMETAALYMNAKRSNKRALAICTVSDNVLTGESTAAGERETSFTEMMKLALETAKKAENN